MKEVLVSFESGEREGIVAVGTYLMDAALRLGVDVDDECRRGSEEHHCAMKISKGADLLSEPTQIEMELLSDAARKGGERLSCQTRIEKAGELSIMSVKKSKKETKEDTKAKEEAGKSGEFKKEFESMPLDEKFASLVELEAIALGETFSYVLNSPYEAAGKLMDVLADFGWKKDRADQEAKKPKEHSEAKKEGGKAEEAKSGSSGKKGSGVEEKDKGD
jgi:ferredoxin